MSNKYLTTQIVRHIFSNLGAIESNFIDINLSKSLKSSDFLLNEKLTFEDENKIIHKNKIYGCQISTEKQELKILLGDCSQDIETPEFCLIVQLHNAPAYGLYLLCDNETNEENIIACTLDKNNWMICNTYLQSTFLAGMEQIRDLGLGWNKCINYQEQYNLLLSFINFHTSFFDELNV